MDSDGIWLDPRPDLRPMRRAPSPDATRDSLSALFWLGWRSGEAEELYDFVVTEQMIELSAVVEAFDRETRVLVRLGPTARLVRAVERFFEVLTTHENWSGATRTWWSKKLRRARKSRVEMYRLLLKDRTALLSQIQQEIRETGDEVEYYIEVLTVLKHGYSALNLLPNERKVMRALFRRIAKLSGIVVMTIPAWFLPSVDVQEMDGYAQIQWENQTIGVHHSDEDEESLLAQTQWWMSLNHPHVAKLYAACHVGRRAYFCEAGRHKEQGLFNERGRFHTHKVSWARVHQCVTGLQYLRQCGLGYRAFSMKRILHRDDRALLSASDVEPMDSEELGRSFAVSLQCVAQRILTDKGIQVGNLRLDSSQESSSSLSPDEQNVLEAMFGLGKDPDEGLVAIIHQLQTLATASDGKEQALSAMPHRPLQAYNLVSISLSFRDVFYRFCAFFDREKDVARDSDRQVYLRLADIYEHLHDQLCSSLTPELVVKFSLVVVRFFRSTVMQSELSCSAPSVSCAARTIASRNYSIHKDIDRLLAFPDVSVDKGAPIHQWTGVWRRNHEQQSARAALDVQDGVLLPRITEAEADRNDDCKELDVEHEEAAVVTLFELTRRRGTRSRAEIDAFLSSNDSLGVAQVAVPDWFIPSYEVELGEFISEGSFGAVYQGKWFDTDVVIKTLIKANNPEQRRAFVHEAELWFMLNHPNIIKLYGACHVGPRPFFVCEMALGCAIPDLTNLTTNPEGYLVQAATGLQYLHARGIAHGDIKGNNILYGQLHTVKLTDFGLSRFTRADESDADDTRALGAYQWKAPECINGSPPTFASDVFSFAMCIIEAVTGKFPWGKLIDEAVKVHVKKGKLPKRPPQISDELWDLVLRMTCYDPSERIDMATVVGVLTTYETQMLTDVTLNT